MDQKAKILEVTLNIIKEDGFNSLTVRKIAKDAKVNVAMINYYFGSKGNLLNQVIAIILDNFKESFIYLDDLSRPPIERIKLFLKSYAEICYKNKSTIRVFMLNGAFEYLSQREYFAFIKSFGFHKVTEIMGEIASEENEQRQAMIALQIIGAIIFPTVMLDAINAEFKVEDSLIEDNIDKYIDLLLNKYIAE
ncbi:MAG: TetR/AcrR family transcriptional regulator [Eubacteriales bacterium]